MSVSEGVQTILFVLAQICILLWSLPYPPCSFLRNFKAGVWVEIVIRKLLHSITFASVNTIVK